MPPRTRRPIVVLLLALVCAPSLAPAASAAPGPAPVAQVVVAGAREKDVATVDCPETCVATWSALGGSPALTLRCLDDGATSRVAWPQPPAFGPCARIESTLERGDALAAVLVWRSR